ncbi:MAG: hypothetical protein U1F30_07295 [Steroidobacteraceae bacterium]
MKRRRVTACLVLLVSAALGACATDRLHRDGLRAVEAGDYEAGIAKLEEAVRQDPANAVYRLDLKGKREEAVQRLVAEADRARAAGKPDEAARGYRRLLELEHGNARALRGLEGVERDRRQAQILLQATREVEQGRLDEAEARLRAVLAEDPGSAAAAALRTRIEATRGPRSVTPHLRSRDNRPVTLQFRDAATKMVFEVLARQTGINFVFDKDVRSDGRTTIFVQQVPVEQAIDLILGQNQLARQVLAENMVMVYPNTTAKQKEYQDQVIRTFYLTNIDPKKAMEMIKTMLNAKTVFVEERAAAVVLRDTPELIRMAERLLAAVDVPESEVMMEVEVLEITRSKLQQLGIRYPEGVTITPTPLAGDPLVLADLRDQDSTTLQISDVSVSADFKRSVGTTNVLASPRIRARNHERAKILIGQRVPVITTSTVLTTGGNGTSSNVQYVDVGLTLDVEPTVYLDGDVAIKVNLEVSSIIKSVTVGESLAYQIGTRNATTLLRLRDGETQILAGLINDQDRRTSDRIPGIGDIPLLGRLFGTNKTDAEKTEIVLSITPRILRSQPRPASENVEFWFGTESTLRSAPLAAGAASPAVEAAPTDSGAGVGVGGAGEPSGIDGRSGADTTDAGPRQRPTLNWEGPGSVSVGQAFDVTLSLGSKVSLSNLRSMVRFDPAVLELQGIDPGGLVGSDAAAAPEVNQNSGRALFDITKGTVSGEGSLFVLHFRAVAARPASMVTLQRFGANGPDGVAVPTLAPRPLTITVQGQ